MPWNKDGTRKKSAFYLRSGNTTPFKEMGASPVKQIPENFNMVGGSGSGTPGFNETKISKTSKGYDISKDKINQALNRAAGGHSESDRISKKAIREAAERQAKSKVKQGAVKTGLKIAGKIAKKVIPPVAAATTIYDIGKFAKDWIQTGDIEQAWDKNKWWGSEKGNLFKKDDK
jgi:hypothetical protein